MRQRILFIASSVLILQAASAPLRADDATFGNDLMATIALQGKRCDKLIKVKRNGDSDYSVVCQDGNRYHIFVNTEGRVMVQDEKAERR